MDDSKQNAVPDLFIAVTTHGQCFVRFLYFVRKSYHNLRSWSWF